ncbi:MAG: hypothetical protein AAGF23_15535 [Acidobacteriota bacterium]
MLIVRPDSQDPWQRRGNVETLATVIADGGYDQRVGVGGSPDGISQEFVRPTRWRKLAATDIEDVSPRVEGAADRPRQIDL